MYRITEGRGNMLENANFLPSAEKYTLPCCVQVETIPGAKSSGVLPGGFCPRYGPLRIGKSWDGVREAFANAYPPSQHQMQHRMTHFLE
jgi:hypothetical protein